MTAKKDKNESAALEKIEAMPEPFRGFGERLHAIILGSAPDLAARVWYGMPGYAKGSGPVLCFFRVDDDIMMLGLTEKVPFRLDDDATDNLMPASWFLKDLDEPTEARVTEIIRQALA